MWGLIFLAAAGVGAILLAYSMGRAAERLDQEIRTAVERHPAMQEYADGYSRLDVRWVPCSTCDPWGEPTACGFAGCLDGYRPEVVDDDAS